MKQHGILNSNILGYSIDAEDPSMLITRTMEYIKRGELHMYMACANPHSLVVASKDKEFELALKNADILIPDGQGIIIAAILLGLPLRERLAGHEFFHALTEKAEKNGGLRYFFLGSTEIVLNLLVQRMIREFPSIIVCGTYSPPFRDKFTDEDNRLMIDAINAARPDVLWVGMTAPKQEKWIYQNRNELQVPFIGAIGAVFDFYAGTRKRSSPLWQKMGLEWLPRLLREPGRLWRRNLVSTPIFLYWVFKEKLKQMYANV